MTRNSLAYLRATLARSTTQGLTLIECLVAIIMVALIGSAITPALVISVATRVQSQKAEQALNLAQSQIDQVRLLAEQDTLKRVASTSTVYFVPQVTTLKDNEVEKQPGPTAGAPVARDQLANATQTFAEDLNGNEFAIQVYRSKGLERPRLRGTVQENEPVAFAVGVRVYDRQAVTAGEGTLSADPSALGVTGGEGGRSRRPLAALYTTVAISEQAESLCDLIRFTQSTSGNTSSVPIGCSP